MFFVMTPLGVRYPRYRLLTSPFIWLMWQIPNHGMSKYAIMLLTSRLTSSLAEWAMARLQAEARHHKHELRDRKPLEYGPREKKPADAELQAYQTHEDDFHNAPLNVGTYRCKSGGGHGRLVVTTESVRFAQRKSTKENWTLSYQDLQAIHKVLFSLLSFDINTGKC